MKKGKLSKKKKIILLILLILISNPFDLRGGAT